MILRAVKCGVVRTLYPCKPRGDVDNWMYPATGKAEEPNQKAIAAAVAASPFQTNDNAEGVSFGC